MNQRRTLLVALGLGLGAGFTAALLFLTRPGPPEDPGVTVVRPAAPIDAFRLEDQRGAAFDGARLQGKWSLLFFGYTHCPDVCPTTLATFRRIHDLLGPLNRDAQYVFVSVDPERDTAEQRGKYASYFNPEFLGVSGTHNELGKLVRSLGVYYRHGEPTEGGGYLVDHSAGVFLINPEGRMQALFSAPHDARRMAAALREIMGQKS
jgi:protein SCO1